MNAATRSVLGDVARALHAGGVPFALGGSGLLWGLGLTDEVRDLDLVVPADQEQAACRALELAPGDVDHDGTELWASVWFVSTRRDDVDVDLIGGMALRVAGRVVRLPWRVDGHLDADGARIPLCDPTLWWVAYRRYKPEKARALEAVLTPRQRAEISLELELGPDW